MKNLPKALFAGLAFCLALYAPGSLLSAEANSCEDLQKLWTESWNCTSNCWDKAKGPCAEGASTTEANAKACGAGADACSNWGTVALYGTAVLVGVSVAWYFLKRASYEGAALPETEQEVFADNLELLPSRTDGGA